MQRRHDAPVDERGREVREDLGAVLRQHRDPGARADATSALRLDQLARPSADLTVGSDPSGKVDTRLVLSLLEAPNDEVGQERLVMER